MATPPPNQFNNGGRRKMHACVESETTPSASPDDTCRKPAPTVLLAIQLAVILFLGAAVFGTLLLDSRQYYGIDVDGQPLYREHPRSCGSTLDIDANG